MRYGFAGLILCAIFCLFLTTDNFQQCAQNAANGQLLFYAEMMTQREDYLRSLHKKNSRELPKFGLAGELLRGGLRRTPPDRNEPSAIVPAFMEAAFPLRTHEDLGTNPESWPNNWAAWLYDLRSLRVQFPDVEYTVKSWLTAQGVEQYVPRPMRDAGIEHAWRFSHGMKDNDIFQEDWIILKAKNLEGYVYILRPNNLSRKRLAPLFLQKYWLEEILSKKVTNLSLQEKLTASEIVFNPVQWHSKGFYAFPLGVWEKGTHCGPSEIFVGLDSEKLYRLGPYK